MKSIAPRQLVGVGDEGFASFLNNADNAGLVSSNPGQTHSPKPLPQSAPAASCAQVLLPALTPHYFQHAIDILVNSVTRPTIFQWVLAW